MHNGKRSVILFLLGIIASTLPVASCVVLYFPLWESKGGGAIISGFSILLLALSALPLFKLWQRLLKSPSAHTVWFILFIIFFISSRIADEMTVISFVGFLGNLVGAIFVKLSGIGIRMDRYNEKR